MQSAPAVSRFAVFSAWRGDVGLLCRTVRSAARAVQLATREKGDEREPECIVEIAVDNDVEVFDSAEDLREWVTMRAIRDFKTVRVCVTGGGYELDLRISRAPSRLGLPYDPAVALTVSSDDAADENGVDAIRNQVADTLSRGGFWFSREPETGNGAATLEEALRNRVSRRNRQMAFLYGGLFAAAIIAVPIVAALTNDEAAADDTYFFIAAGVALLGIPLAVWISKILGAKARRWIRSVVDRAVFPAVEIADVQPGRRWIRIGMRLVPVVLAPAVGPIVEAFG